MDTQAENEAWKNDPRAGAALYAIASLAVRGGGRESEGGTRAVFQEILDCVAGVFGASSGSIALLDADSGLLVIEAQKNLPENAREFFLRPGQGITGWVFFQRKALLARDTAEEPRYISLRKDVRCEMAAPLMDAGGERVLGVINLDHVERGAFSEEDFALFTRLAREAAWVIARVWELRQLRGKARQLEALVGIGQALVEKVEEQDLLAAVTRDAREIMQCAACAFYLHVPEHEAAEFVVQSSEFGVQSLRGTEVELDSSVAGAVIRTRRQLEFADVSGAEFLDLLDIPRGRESEPRPRSVLASPLLWKGEVLGVLAVFTERAHRFSNDEKRLLDALAGLGAVALQNARLYARVSQSEALLRKNEQLTTLGLLAAEIAHEIRNPLTVIKLLYGQLGLEFEAGDPRRTDVRVIGEKLDQLEAIVSRVLNFARAPSGLHSRWALADVIGDTVALMRLKFARQKIALRYEAPSHRILVDVNKGQMQQVLLNVLLNSMEAMPGGGVISICVAVVDADAQGQGRVVHVDVSDTGGGIAEGVRGRIFDSFLSGRPDGTGLGLAIAKRIMLGHHGDIVLLETGAGGTTFRLSLPVA